MNVVDMVHTVNVGIWVVNIVYLEQKGQPTLWTLGIHVIELHGG